MDILDSIRNLKINYATVDLKKEYLDLSKDLDIDSYLNYEDTRNEIYSGPFHLALSVKVFKDTSFIPFISLINNDKDYLRATKTYVKDIVEHKLVKYNYTDLLTDIHNLLVARNICDDEHLAEIILDVEYDELKDEINVCSVKVDIINSQVSLEDEVVAEINDLVRSKRNMNFLYLLAKFYNSKGDRRLYYAFYSFDGEFSSNVSLTQFIIIARDLDEIKEFFLRNVRKLRNLASYLRTRYTYDLFEKGKVEAIKSAISAIMSRNMSHNLGSHYLYYTKAHLEELAKTQTDIAPDIRGSAKVLGYIQARMDYLATVISNDKYPYGAVNFKSQIYDELTVDKFSKRHFYKDDDKNLRTTNFLLANLVFSENFSISDIHENDNISSRNSNRKTSLDLYVKLQDESGLYEQFTGTNSMARFGWPTHKTEEHVKDRLSNLYIALPGGIMSSHALFNVIENFIRNSAKYLQVDFKEEGLIFNIAIREHIGAEDGNSYVDLILYDNKRNANKCQSCKVNYITKTLDSQQRQTKTLYEVILNKLGGIKIVNDSNNEIEKDNKGFKEILFSSAWMKSYTYSESTYADIMAEINADSDEDTKLSLIEKYGFSLIQVVERKVGSKNNTRFHLDVYDRSTYRQIPENDIPDANLGIMITLPKFNNYVEFETKDSLKANVESMLNVYSDIVGVDEKYYANDVISHCFPRAYKGKATSPVAMLKEILNERFGNIDDYKLVLDDTNGQCKENFDINLSESERIAKTIYFKRHLNSKARISDYVNYAYADTVSGGNFTVTINDLIKKGLLPDGTYKDEDSEFFALKVKESALTRITIIDERLYNSMVGRELENAIKNLRVLNYTEEKDDHNYLKGKDNNFNIFDHILKGNEFSDHRNGTHFLSIHLGLVEKMLKNSVLLNNQIDKYLIEKEINSTSNDNLAPERVTAFMRLLERNFDIGGNSTFVSVHSGRGNFSKELEGPLARYPFVSLSALENAFNNSKYLLSQIFYNTVYIGKGMANDSTIK